MLGMIYTEFFNMAEDVFGIEITEKMIEQSMPNLPSNAVYTSVGNYSHKEIIVLVSQLSGITGIGITELIQKFGMHLFGRFHQRYPDLFAEGEDAFGFLERVEDHIHVNVRSLYPEAELPSFECVRQDPNTLVMEYRSQRPFATLAHGMILGCLEYFKETGTVSGEEIADDDLKGYLAGHRFTIVTHG